MAIHRHVLTAAALLLFVAAAVSVTDARRPRNMCPVMVQRRVTCRVKNGTEEYMGTDYSKCSRTGNWNDCRLTVKRRRSKYINSYKTVNEMQYRCCPGFHGQHCYKACFSCGQFRDTLSRVTTLEQFVGLRSANGLPQRHVAPPAAAADRAPRGDISAEEDDLLTNRLQPPPACNCPPGRPGRPGRPGADGQPGAVGLSGPEGPEGPRGARGGAGPPGLDGLPGVAGPQGPPGESGPAGAAGQTPPGVSPLVPAAQAPPGPPGPAGPAGPRGPPGPRGSRGEDGVAGRPGRDGAEGQVGLRGLPGRVGDTGATGLDGERGPAGQPGGRGRPGPTGAAGAPGLAGTGGSAGGSEGDPATAATSAVELDQTRRQIADLESRIISMEQQIGELRSAVRAAAVSPADSTAHDYDYGALAPGGARVDDGDDGDGGDGGDGDDEDLAAGSGQPDDDYDYFDDYDYGSRRKRGWRAVVADDGSGRGGAGVGKAGRPGRRRPAWPVVAADGHRNAARSGRQRRP